MIFHCSQFDKNNGKTDFLLFSQVTGNKINFPELKIDFLACQPVAHSEHTSTRKAVQGL